MTETQKRLCESIITSHIEKAGMFGEWVTIPGTSVIVDLSTMVTMTLSIAKVFELPLSPAIAKDVSIKAIQHVAVGYVARKVLSDACKIVPVVGRIAAGKFGSKISQAMLTEVGWEIVNALENNKNLSLNEALQDVSVPKNTERIEKFQGTVSFVKKNIQSFLDKKSESS